MKVFRDIKNCKINNPVVTLGSFDGVHLGHLKVLDRLNQITKEVGGESVIFTFYPHPRQVLYPNEPQMKLLNTMEEKISLLEKAGVDNIIFYPFTKEFANLSYEEFVKDILIGELGMKHLVVGYDHHFGKDREGDFDSLNEMAKKNNFTIVKESAFDINHINISSTKIRNALKIGDVKTASIYLNYNYTIEGKVVEGCQLGRTLGFPTANLELLNDNKLIPTTGVYAVYIDIEGKRYKGMLNIGLRPTVSKNSSLSIEVNIFDFDREIYGETVRLYFVERIRGERKFENIEELKNHLCIDKRRILKILEE